MGNHVSDQDSPSFYHSRLPESKAGQMVSVDVHHDHRVAVSVHVSDGVDGDHHRFHLRHTGQCDGHYLLGGGQQRTRCAE